MIMLIFFFYILTAQTGGCHQLVIKSPETPSVHGMYLTVQPGIQGPYSPAAFSPPSCVSYSDARAQDLLPLANYLQWVSFHLLSIKFFPLLEMIYSIIPLCLA